MGAGLLLAGPLAVPAAAQTQEPPKVQMPQPGVPQITTMEGRYVRIASKDIKKQIDDAFKRES